MIESEFQAVVNENELKREYDICEDFRLDNNKFVGEFENKKKKYRLLRKYIDGRGDQLRLYYSKFSPFDKAICSLALVHGLGEHSGRYYHVADHLVQSNVEVHMIDLRGFGHSGGARGSSPISEFHHDILTLLEQLDKHLPVFIMGFSMGGMLVSSFLLTNPHINLNAVILVNPLMKVPDKAKLVGAKAFMIKSLGEDLNSLVTSSMLNATSLTKDSYQLMKIFKDKMQIPFMQFCLAKYILECTEFLQDHFFKFNYPLFMLLGQKDQIVEYYPSLNLYNQCQTKDKSIKLFPEGYHEMHNDQEFSLFVQTLNQYILQKLNPNILLTNTLSNLKFGYTLRPLHFKRKIIFFFLLLLVFLGFIKKLKNLGAFKFFLQILSLKKIKK